MQSGISASSELRAAFQSFVSSSSQRGLLVSIQNESLVPAEAIESKGSFYSDLSDIHSQLQPNAALYILLRRADDPSSSQGPGSLIAITYVPNAAPVRQKTLFASTRLSLVRELGSEHFGESFFATEASELSEEGWRKHEAHSDLSNPLTREEEDLVGIKEAEARESGGTGARKGHTGGSVDINIGDKVVEALRDLGSGGGDNLVLLNFDVPKETVVLLTTRSTDASSLSSALPTDTASYAFYRHSNSAIVFIYTCPTASKVKERMLYATSTRSVVNLAQGQAGLEIAKRLEASDPDEITQATIEELFGEKKVEETKSTFSKPKRPGRR